MLPNCRGRAFGRLWWVPLYLCFGLTGRHYYLTGWEVKILFMLALECDKIRGTAGMVENPAGLIQTLPQIPSH